MSTRGGTETGTGVESRRAALAQPEPQSFTEIECLGFTPTTVQPGEVHLEVTFRLHNPTSFIFDVDTAILLDGQVVNVADQSWRLSPGETREVFQGDDVQVSGGETVGIDIVGERGVGD